MKRITSFSVDHDLLNPGMYISRIDGDVITYDLRTRKPNCGVYMDTTTLHSVEHMMATFLRNSNISDNVLYFGPMGCQTGFYLLVRDTVKPEEVKEILLDCLKRTIQYEGEVFGASRKECGNYLDLNLDKAKKECTEYLKVLLNLSADTKFDYPERSKDYESQYRR